MTNEEFARAMKSIASELRVSIDAVAEKAPRDFWEKVSASIGMNNKEEARRYWRLHREPLCEILGVTPHNDRITRNEIQALMDAMKDELTELIDAKLEVAGGKVITSASEASEKPPVKKFGKEYAGKKADIRGLIDLALYELLEADAAENHNGNMSSCIDKALWHFYGKPALSFQWPEEELDRRYAKYLKSKKKRRR